MTKKRVYVLCKIGYQLKVTKEGRKGWEEQLNKSGYMWVYERERVGKKVKKNKSESEKEGGILLYIRKKWMRYEMKNEKNDE